MTLALNPIEVHEQQFIDSKTGDRFMVLGVDYQPGGQGSYGTDSGDPLSNPEICLRDAALMQNLGVNTIRSYNLNPTLDHDQCVSIFNQAGIYMIIDVNSPLSGESIDRSNPEGTYTSKYLQRAFSVVEAFKDYPNTLGCMCMTCRAPALHGSNFLRMRPLLTTSFQSSAATRSSTIFRLPRTIPLSSVQCSAT